jgi:RNA recognition motif-containing protein
MEGGFGQPVGELERLCSCCFHGVVVYSKRISKPICGMENTNQDMSHLLKVFVGNLPYSISESRLKQVFVEAGGFQDADITDVIILKAKKNPEDSRPPLSKGVGFVAFTTPELAKQAIQRVNEVEVEYEVKGEPKRRPIFVHEARPFTAKEQ